MMKFLNVWVTGTDSSLAGSTGRMSYSGAISDTDNAKKNVIKG